MTIPETGDIVADDQLGLVLCIQCLDVFMLCLQELGNVEDEGDEEGRENVWQDSHSRAVGHLQGPVENWSETLISSKIYIFYDNFVGSNLENIWTYVIFKFEVFELAKKKKQMFL